jgi:hypothetical protein
MCAVILGWVLFRSASIADFWKYILSMAGIGEHGFVDDVFLYYIRNASVVLPVSILCSTPIYRIVGSKRAMHRPVVQAAWAFCLIALFTVSILVCIKSTYNPFIYFNF